jgi:hypothetical protein
MFRLTDLTTYPSNTDSRFIVFAAINTTHSVTLRVSFDNIYSRTCTGWTVPLPVNSDYELWSPNASQCILGHVSTFVRRRRDVLCAHPAAFTNATASVVNCKCVAADFTCAYCFTLTSSGKCVPDTSCGSDPRAPPATCVGSYSAPSGTTATDV